jgi:N6-L-threonylcarbamoyladenine synthase
MGSFTSAPLDESLIVPLVKVRVAPSTSPAPQAPTPTPAQPETDPDVVRPLPVADLAASFQAAVVDALVQKTAAAVAETGAREVLVAGGVAANALLRTELGERLNVPFRYPPISLCTDNAAMIAAAAFFRYSDCREYDFTMDIEPNARYV